MLLKDPARPGPLPFPQDKDRDKAARQCCGRDPGDFRQELLGPSVPPGPPLPAQGPCGSLGVALGGGGRARRKPGAPAKVTKVVRGSKCQKERAGKSFRRGISTKTAASPCPLPRRALQAPPEGRARPSASLAITPSSPRTPPVPPAPTPEAAADGTPVRAGLPASSLVGTSPGSLQQSEHSRVSCDPLHTYP